MKTAYSPDPSLTGKGFRQAVAAGVITSVLTTAIMATAILQSARSYQAPITRAKALFVVPTNTMMRLAGIHRWLVKRLFLFSQMLNY